MTTTTDNHVEKKTRAAKTPKGFDRILKGALALTLNERVGLVTKLRDSIQAEVETAEAMADQAKKIASAL